MPQPPAQDIRPYPPALPTADDAPLTPSKSQRKRDAHALQTLGIQLVALSVAQLARLDLPEALHEAVVAAQRMHSHGARTMWGRHRPAAWWPTLYLTDGAALADGQRQETPRLATRHRGPHVGRSGCGRRPRERDTRSIS